MLMEETERAKAIVIVRRHRRRVSGRRLPRMVMGGGKRLRHQHDRGHDNNPAPPEPQSSIDAGGRHLRIDTYNPCRRKGCRCAPLKSSSRPRSSHIKRVRPRVLQ
jgi:hypothetical protein